MTTPTRNAEVQSSLWIPDEAQILFVGDIQGCAEDLARLLEHAGFDARIHRLVPLGDTVNRGPDAPGVLRMLRELRATPILGNHERALLSLDPTQDLPQWAKGGASAYHQLRKDGTWDEALAWMRQWPVIARGPGWIAVHAGLHPQEPPENTDPGFLTTVRWCTARGVLPDKGVGNGLDAPQGFSPWHMFYRGLDMVFFGHWARQGLLLRERLRGLDTGCVYGRQLTGVWWPEDRLVQVDALKR